MPGEKDEGKEFVEKYNAEKARADKLAADFEEFKKKFADVDPEDYKASKAKLQELETKHAKTPEEIDALINERVEKQTKKDREAAAARIKALEDENAGYKTKIHEIKVVDGVFSKIAGDVNEDMHDFIKSKIKTELDADADGNIFVRDEKGKPKLIDGHKPMTVEDWVKQTTERHRSAFKSTFKAGAKPNGEVKTGSHASGISPADYMKMTPEQRGRLPQAEQRALSHAALFPSRKTAAK